MRLPILAAAVASTAVSGLAQLSLVIPNGSAAADASSSTAYPWDRGASVIHVQYCYDATHFTAQGITYPIVITQLKWRANATTATTTGGTYATATIDVSTSAFDQAALTTTFATNHGPDRVNAYTGAVVALPTPAIAAPTPNIWFVDV